ncbi:unnamed protein product, partial [Staurois parvus]
FLVTHSSLCFLLLTPHARVLDLPLQSSTLPTVQCLQPLSANPSIGLHSASSTPLCQSLHWPPFSVLHPSLPIHPLAYIVSSTPLCQSLHWPPFCVLHPSLPNPPMASIQCPPAPSLPIPPLASIQCPPPLSANPSTGLHSVSSTPLCQSLHWTPFSVLHPSLTISLLASIQCPPPI